jgi:hypothetical protein
MESSVFDCPVPAEQQPINEYQQLQASCFFSCPALDWPAYASKLVGIGFGSWLIVAPVVAASFPLGKQPIQFVLASAGGANLFVLLILLRLYLGWFYVRDRLHRETVTYEESGWYDGQTWQKTPEILARDRLVVTYEVQPILQRLQRTFTILGIFFGVLALIWLLPFSSR